MKKIIEKLQEGRGTSAPDTLTEAQGPAMKLKKTLDPVWRKIRDKLDPEMRKRGGDLFTGLWDFLDELDKKKMIESTDLEEPTS